jgi:predicted nucleic acid-binding Zn ribbon protein
MTIVRSITDKENKPICAKCAQEMIRVFYKPAITFKGTGWASKE